MSKRVVVFGATGDTGQQIVRQAADRGLKVVAFVRDPGKLQTSGPNVEVVQGDIADLESIDAALDPGADAVFSALGMYRKKPTTELSDGTKLIIDSMRRHGVRRLLVVSSIGVGDSAGHGTFIVRLIQKTTLKHVLADKERQEAAIRDSGLDWTVVRPPRIMRTPGICDDLVTWKSDQPEQVSWQATTGSIAKLLLDTFEQERWVREAVNFSEPRN